MRIAVLSAAKSTQTVRLVNALAKRGHVMALYSLPEHKAPYSMFDSNVDVHYLRRSGVLGCWFSGSELADLLVKFRPDVLNAHYATGYGTIARRSGFHPLLLSVWGSDVYDVPAMGRFYRGIIQKNIFYADAATAASGTMEDRVKALTRLESLVYVTPFGVDTERFFPEEEKPEGVTVGCMRVFETDRGAETLIRAFSLLQKRLLREGRMPEGGLRLVIYGDVKQQKELRALAKNLSVRELVDFGGHLPQSQAPAALRKLNIFCIPGARNESYSIPAAEAMACGLPVVANDDEAFSEMIENKVTGFVVAKKDYVTLSNKLYELTLNGELRRKMGEAARARALSLYRWDDCVARLENALEETAKQKPPATDCGKTVRILK